MAERHHPENMTDVQEAFFRGLTDQRVANMWQAADDWADLSPESKEWLHRADKEQIEKLKSTIDFMNSSRIIWRFLWVGASMILAAFVGFKTFWTTFGEYFTVKIK